MINQGRIAKCRMDVGGAFETMQLNVQAKQKLNVGWTALGYMGFCT